MRSSSMPSSLPNRWLLAITAFLMQLALGSVYAWSVFLKPVGAVYHVSRLQANLTFSIVLLALGVTAGFGGYLNNRFGPRVIATVGGILYGLGVLLAAFAAPNIFILYLTLGIIGGIGIGLGYIVALAMLIKWFPDRRGFITGLAVAGFGAGALITSPVAAALITSVGLGRTFLSLGIAYLVVIVIVAQFFRTAPESYIPSLSCPPLAALHCCWFLQLSSRSATVGALAPCRPLPPISSVPEMREPFTVRYLPPGVRAALLARS
jgi:MFS transporter, OFA family, oxalate/formate antiporter